MKNKGRSGKANQNSKSNQSYHSPRDGEMVNGRPYCRMYDFNRDAWYDLVRKLINWREGTKSKFIPTIEKKINERIKKGSCTRKEVYELIYAKLSKKSNNPKKVKVNDNEFFEIDKLNDKSSIKIEKIVINLKIKNLYL